MVNPKQNTKTYGILIALGAILIVAVFIVKTLAPQFETNPITQDAAIRTQKAFQEIYKWRLEKGIAIDKTLDPKETGLIGCEYSDITSTSGDLAAKQLSINPAYAALVAQWLMKAGVQSNDSVAVSFSGSFPALNIATLCALDAIGAKGCVFSSLGASVYGANIPGLSWLDMERHLLEQGLLQNKTTYASYGGITDVEGGLDGTGFEIAKEAINKHGAIFINEGTPKNVSQDAKRRMTLFFQNGAPKAFVNVGGNITSLGWVAESSLLSNGPLNAKQIPKIKSEARGTIFRMSELGVPVIHLLNIKRLSDKYHVAQYADSKNLGEAFASEKKKHEILLAGALLFWFSLSSVLLLRARRRTRPKH